MNNTVLIKVSSIFKPIIGPNRYVSGIGRSTYQLLKAIGNLDNIPFNIILYGAGLSSIHSNANDLRFPYRCFPLPMKLGNRITKLEPYFINNVYKHDLLHIPHNYDYALSRRMNFVVTIHDTCDYDTAIVNSDIDKTKVWRFAAETSRRIVTCSQSTKNDILDRFQVPEDKVVVIPWGISTDLFHPVEGYKIDQVRKKYNLKEHYFLAVSCSNRRKNIANLLEAYRNYSKKRDSASMVLLWSNPPQDVLVANKYEIEKGKIRFIDYVTDEDLVALYNGALATMYPSRYEGFGFPILESFACGTPVMTCKNSSLYEVGGDYAVYVGEDNIDEMTKTMEYFCDSDLDKSQFYDKVRDHLYKFSWENTARLYVDFYKQTIDNSNIQRCY